MDKHSAAPDGQPFAGPGTPAPAQGPSSGPTRTLADIAYQTILSRVVSGEFAVGAKLPTEQSLGEDLGVSRPVLRRALKQLREDGLITSRQGSGSYVRRRPDQGVLQFAPVGSIADIQRIFELRAAIESDAAYLAAERRSEATMRQLKGSLDELARCVREGELGVDADEAFHALICAASDNHYFVSVRNSMRENILAGLRLTRNLSLTRPRARLALVQAEHDVIYEAIARRDREGARQAMRRHIENARERVFEGDSGMV
jgi:DNA-binding FadR family transcriptional regulator